ncbi:MAG: DUF6206 family protein [Candidatus Hodarchaeota archaeon]
MEINEKLIKEFENSIDTIHLERGEVPIKLLGFGEISLVFEFLNDIAPIAYKRLPIFESKIQVNRHISAYIRYHEILTRLGIQVPPEDSIWIRTSKNKIVLYCAQEKISPETIGNRIIHDKISKNDFRNLILLIMQKLSNIWLFNNRSKKIQVGIDGQISNWSLTGYDSGRSEITEDEQLVYLDTSTPMFRVNGIEAMEPDLFLKSAPSFLRWLLKALFVEEVVGRYYDFRNVAIDLIANFYKEQKPNLIPESLNIINTFFKEEVSQLEIPPISYDEIYSYYNGFLGDKQIWVIFQNARRIDRYLQTKMLKKGYDFYLPNKIKR